MSHFGTCRNALQDGTDVASRKDGRGLHDSMKTLLDLLHPLLWSKIFIFASDGASAMRSTVLYAGMDGKSDGTSMHETMVLLGRVVTWRMTLPTMLQPARPRPRSSVQDRIPFGIAPIPEARLRPRDGGNVGMLGAITP